MRKIDIAKFGKQLCHCFRIPMCYREHKNLHIHDAHEFYFCDAGGGSQHTEQVDITMQDDDLYLFPAGVAHIGIGAQHGNSSGIVLTVRPEAFEEYSTSGHENMQLLQSLCDKHNAANPRIPLSLHSRKQLRPLMKALVDECQYRPPGFRTAVQGYLRQFLVLLLRDEETGPDLRALTTPANDDERLAVIMRLFASQMERNWSIEEMAALTGLGRSRFHQVFKDATGLAPMTYLNDVRIAEAKKLLTETDASVLEIALQVGYGSLSHFYEQFNKRSLSSPRAFRQLNS